VIARHPFLNPLYEFHHEQNEVLFLFSAKKKQVKKTEVKEQETS